MKQPQTFVRTEWVDIAIGLPAKADASESWWAKPLDREVFQRTAKAESKRMSLSKFGSVTTLINQF